MIWATGTWPMRLHGFSLDGIHGWMKFVLNPRNLPSDLQQRWREFILYVAIVVDSIWYARNSLVHHKVPVDVQDIQTNIRRRFDEHFFAWGEVSLSRPIRWQPPPDQVF